MKKLMMILLLSSMMPLCAMESAPSPEVMEKENVNSDASRSSDKPVAVFMEKNTEGNVESESDYSGSDGKGEEDEQESDGWSPKSNLHARSEDKIEEREPHDANQDEDALAAESGSNAVTFFVEKDRKVIVEEAQSAPAPSSVSFDDDDIEERDTSSAPLSLSEEGAPFVLDSTYQSTEALSSNLEQNVENIVCSAPSTPPSTPEVGVVELVDLSDSGVVVENGEDGADFVEDQDQHNELITKIQFLGWWKRAVQPHLFGKIAPATFGAIIIGGLTRLHIKTRHAQGKKTYFELAWLKSRKFARRFRNRVLRTKQQA
jgi:hypothetical protein